MAKAYPSVNLLKPRSILLDELVDWALNVGRLLIILTELVAFSMFFYRFFLDRQIIDLKDKITQERQVIALFKTREDEFRSIQEKLIFSSQLIESQKQQKSLLNTITSSVPSDSSLTSVLISSKSANISISSQNLTSLKTYVETLKKDKEFESVSISIVDTNPSTAQISLGIIATLKIQQ